MKWKDFVNKSIKNYPTLYLAKTWEDSEFLVAEHVFCVLGNGMEWAVGPNGEQYGYMTSQKYRKVDGEWELLPDKPYGEEKCRLKSSIFSEQQYERYVIDHVQLNKSNVDDVFFGLYEICNQTKDNRVIYNKKTIQRLYKDKKYHIIEDSTSSRFKRGITKQFYNQFDYIFEPIGREDSKRTKEHVSPYPNFNKQYAPVWEIDVNLIKEDWRLAALSIYKHWKQWFDNEANHKKYHHSYKKGELKNYIDSNTTLQKEKNSNFNAFVEKIRIDYDCDVFNGYNYEEMAHTLWNKQLVKIKKFIDETITRLETVERSI